MSKKRYRLVSPLILTVTFSLLYFPLLIIAALSVNSSKLDYKFTGLSWKWYKEIFTHNGLLEVIKTTWIIAILATILSTIIGTLFALGINSLRAKKRKRLLMLNVVPLINADIVTAVSLSVIFSFLGITFGYPTLLLAHVFFCIPFVVISVLPKLSEIDEDIYFAARDLGMSKFEAIIKVVIPHIKTGIITGALMAFTMSIDDFVISYFVQGNGVNNFSIWLYSAMGRKSFTPAAYAYNTLVTILIFAIIIFISSKNNIKRRGR